MYAKYNVGTKVYVYERLGKYGSLVFFVMYPNVIHLSKRLIMVTEQLLVTEQFDVMIASICSRSRSPRSGSRSRSRSPPSRRSGGGSGGGEASKANGDDRDAKKARKD